MKEAVCILIYNLEHKILGVSRKDNPNDFGLPGGKVDHGETREEAAVREAKEEAGLDIFNLSPVFTREARGDDTYSATTFEAEYDPAQEIGSEEAGVVAWVDWETLFNGSFGQYNRKLYEELF